MKTEAEFDQYAEDYYQMLKSSITKSGEQPEFFAEYKIQDTLQLTKKLSFDPKVIFDFGSGIGNSIPFFRKYFPKSKLICADISSKSLDISKKRFPGSEEYFRIYEGGIDLPDESVDLVFSTCVFHHIDHEEHSHWLRELLRILKVNGVLMIFEHNPSNPLTVSTVKHCPIDVNAKLIPGRQLKSLIRNAGGRNIDLAYRIFFPHTLSFLRPFEKYLKKIHLGAQYYVCARKL
ncbi:MAG TPA: class I SAM-dependent methyltransferase [Chryseolinea sp.]|nr:class I SAM-dependent methyltransferase [Chryseolinea sp.]